MHAPLPPRTARSAPSGLRSLCPSSVATACAALSSASGLITTSESMAASGSAAMMDATPAELPASSAFACAPAFAPASSSALVSKSFSLPIPACESGVECAPSSSSIRQFYGVLYASKSNSPLKASSWREWPFGSTVGCPTLRTAHASAALVAQTSNGSGFPE